MMVGTILSNFWAALIAFSFYFFFSYPFIDGMVIILEALFVATFFFIGTFFARAIIGYIISNPLTEREETTTEEKTEILKSEISPEDYAVLVKEMLQEDEKPKTESNI